MKKVSKDHNTSIPSKPFPELYIYDYEDEFLEINELLLDIQEGYEKEDLLRRKRSYTFLILNSALLYKIKEILWLIASKGDKLTEEEKKYYNTTLNNHKKEYIKLHMEEVNLLI